MKDIALSGIMANINPAAAKGGLVSTVRGYSLDGTLTDLDPTSKAWSDYYWKVRDYELTGTITQIDFSSAAKGALVSAFAGLGISAMVMAKGGIIRNGQKIPMYAGGTTNAHGSLFMAGENGAEIVGNVNGQTEILNKSQMAAAMYTAAKAGMAQAAQTINSTLASGVNAVINAITYRDTASTFNAEFASNNSDGGMSALIDGVREGVFEATAQQNELLRQQNEILLDLLAKDNTTEISTNSVVNSLTLKNRRDGKYVVPVGVV